MLPINASAWERWGQALENWAPYLTLAIAALLSLAQPGQDWAAHLGTAIWVGLAGAWVFVMYTRVPEPRRERLWRMRIYFAGLLAFATALTIRQPIFFIFMITGFFHASLLRPWPLMVLGAGATSVLINTLFTGFPWPSVELWSIYGSIIIIQTLTIGFGIVLAEKLAEVSEQRRQVVAKLEAALEENAALHAQLLAQAREAGVRDERQRMAREIHDTIAQGLIGIVTQLEALGQAKDRPDDWQRHLDNAARLARASLAEARRSVEGSRPASLEGAGLPEALAEVAQQWSRLHSIPLELTTTGEVLPLHAEIETALLRTAQEALANVAKHSRASRAGVTLSYMGDVVTLDVRDDGVGFEPSAVGGAGFGLTAMRQRVSRVAGTLAIESEPGGGTAISARIPAIIAQQEARNGGSDPAAHRR